MVQLQASHLHDLQDHARSSTKACVVRAASRGYSFVVWLRVEGTKAQGAPAGRALFTLRGSTPEGPKGVAAAVKGKSFRIRAWAQPTLGVSCQYASTEQCAT